MTTREEHKIKAKWCEHAERYDDMVTEMKTLVEGKIDFFEMQTSDFDTSIF